MIGTRPIAVLLAAALLAAGAIPLPAQETQTVADYARREARSPELAEFQGGFHGVVDGVAISIRVCGHLKGTGLSGDAVVGG